jgi:tetratricopeptide (TPR) repeat protein
MGQLDRRKNLSTRGRSVVAFTLLVVPWLFTPAAAQAAGRQAQDSRQAQEKAARKACLSGDYATGISILSDLFIDTKDPTYIFNQARCFQQSKRYDDAIARFQEYLRAAPNVDAADKAAAEKHIADCQELIAKQTGQPAPAATPTSDVHQQSSPPIQAAATTLSTSTLVAEPANSQTHPASGSYLRVAGITTASVGAATLVAGVLLNLKVNSMASDLETYGSYTANKESQRKTYETLGWISYSLGGACVAAGAVLYYLGLRAGSNAPSSMSLVPVFASDRAGAAIGGTF